MGADYAHEINRFGECFGTCFGDAFKNLAVSALGSKQTFTALGVNDCIADKADADETVEMCTFNNSNCIDLPQCSRPGLLIDLFEVS